jgi:hypothetical protein
MAPELPILLRPHAVPVDKYNKMNPVEKMCFKISQGIGFVVVFGWHLTHCTPTHWFTKPNFGCTRESAPVQKDTR